MVNINLKAFLSPDVIGRCTAKAKVDLIFLIDTADPNKNIQNVKKLIKEISTCISISDHLTSVSLLKYRQRLNLGIPLGGWDKYTQSKAKLRQHLDAITINHDRKFANIIASVTPNSLEVWKNPELLLGQR